MDPLEIAILEAEKSMLTFRHGATLIVNGKVVSSSRNHVKASHNIHAEVGALQAFGGFHSQRLGKKVYAVIYVVRLTKGCQLTYSKPCQNCIKLLKRIGIKRILYSGYHGELLTMII